MIEKIICQNKHKMIIDWEGGLVSDRPCVNEATKYTVDKYGIFYLCDECHAEGTKRRLDSRNMTLKKDKGV